MNDFSGLTASVLDIGEVQKVKDEWRDLAYKTENQTFEIFWSEKIKTAENVSVEVLYNPAKVSLDIDNASWENYEILNQDDGILRILLRNLWLRNHEEGRFEVPFSWDNSQILLWDSWKTEKKETISLSIGNLNKIDEHSI